MNYQTSLLVTFEILGLFFNTLTVDDKYPCYKKQSIPAGNSSTII